jgi:hypothetical protein
VALESSVELVNGMGGINGKAWTNTYANYLLIVLTISACSFLIMRPHGLSITAKFLTTPTAADSMELRVVANLSFLTAEWQHATGIMFVAGTYDSDEQTYKLGMRVYTIPGAGQQSISMLGYAELQGEELKLNGATVLDTKNNTDRPFVALGPEDPRSIVDPYGNLLFSFHQPHVVPINNIFRLLRPQFLLNMTTEEVSLLKHSQYDVLLEQNVQPEMSVAAGNVPFFPLTFSLFEITCCTSLYNNPGHFDVSNLLPGNHVDVLLQEWRKIGCHSSTKTNSTL